MDGFRHENKYFISRAGYQFLRGRLAAMLETDSHAVQSDGRYKIRSLYFDDYKQSGLLDKVRGWRPGRSSGSASTTWMTASSGWNRSRSTTR